MDATGGRAAWAMVCSGSAKGVARGPGCWNVPQERGESAWDAYACCVGHRVTSEKREGALETIEWMGNRQGRRMTSTTRYLCWTISR